MLAIVTLLPLAFFAADLAGVWNMTADAPDGKIYKFTLSVKTGDTPSAVVSNPQYPSVPTRHLVVTSDEISFDIPNPDVEYVAFKLKLDNGMLKGLLRVPEGDQGSVTGVRAVSADVDGAWKLLAKTASGRELLFTLKLERRGETLVGSITPEQGGEAAALADVALRGSELAFKISMGNGDILVKATLDGDQLTGTFKSPDGNDGSFKASRMK